MVCYHDCIEPDCAGCLPSDEQVAVMSTRDLLIDAHRRASLVGLPKGPPEEKRAAVLAGADAYRTAAAG